MRVKLHLSFDKYPFIFTTRDDDAYFGASAKVFVFENGDKRLYFERVFLDDEWAERILMKEGKNREDIIK